MTRTVPGYRLAFQPEDGQSLPQVAAQAPTKLAADPAVAAVLGTYNSSSAQSAAPILAQRSIVQVSPANIGPALTRGENAATDRRRPFLSYFQVAANDLVQGQIGARHLVQKAGKKRIAVIDDGKTYGVGLVGNFVAEAERLVAREKVGEKDTDFSSPIAAIRSSRPDAVYYGGEYPAVGPLARQVAEAGLDIPLMGGDGIADPQYIELGGGPVTSRRPSVPRWTRCRARGRSSTPTPMQTTPSRPVPTGAMTFDATNVIIEALASGT